MVKIEPQTLESVIHYPDHFAMYTEQKATIYQVTTTVATYKNVLFPGHNHLLTTSTDDPTLCLSPKHKRVAGHQYWWLGGGYDLEIGQF